jgi:3-dehydroquinate synthase
VLHALLTIGFRLWDDCLDLRDAHGRRSILAGLEQFREHLGGELTLAMPDGLGQRRDISSFDEILFERALKCLYRIRSTPVAPTLP